MAADNNSSLVVLTTNRSGSVWVMSTLNSLQGVTAQGELFLPRQRVAEREWDSDFACRRYIEAKFELKRSRPFSVFSYLSSLYDTPGAIGFKLMYAQLRLYPEILAYLVKHRIHVVHLVCRNHLDVVVSHAVKAKIGRAHVLTGQSAPEDIRVALDADRLVKKMAWLAKQQNIARTVLNWCGLQHLEVAYEDLLRDQNQFRNICQFLSIEPYDHLPESTLVKIRKGGHRDVISNYDQVKDALVNSQFNGMLA